MIYILDFQAFKDEKNSFIVKELAIASTADEKFLLKLFRPPYSFRLLSPNLKKQVIWLEKHFHELLWDSGLKDYSDLEKVLKEAFKYGGEVYVKGIEKTNFIRDLTKTMGVRVTNMEELGCPSFDVLRHQMKNFKAKQCPFSHSLINCALSNVQLMLEWWKIEKLMLDRMEVVNLAIKDYFNNGFKRMSSDLVKHLPKDFILNSQEDIENIYDKLPKWLKDDEEIKKNLRCDKHYDWRSFCEIAGASDWDGKNPKRKHCYFCIAESLTPTN